MEDCLKTVEPGLLETVQTLFETRKGRVIKAALLGRSFPAEIKATFSSTPGFLTVASVALGGNGPRSNARQGQWLDLALYMLLLQVPLDLPDPHSAGEDTEAPGPASQLNGRTRGYT